MASKVAIQIVVTDQTNHQNPTANGHDNVIVQLATYFGEDWKVTTLTFMASKSNLKQQEYGRIANH